MAEGSSSFTLPSFDENAEGWGPTQPPPQYHYHSQQGQPGQQPPPQSGRGGAYRPFDAPMDGYPGAERPPRPQPPPQQPRRRGSDNGGCAIS